MKTQADLPVYPPRFIIRITATLRHFFLRMNRRFTHPNVVLWEMAHNLWLAAGIGVAAQLGLADLLKEQPHTIDFLAEQTGTHPESLYRVMRMLASHGIFKEISGRRFASTPLARPLQDDQIRYLLMFHLTPFHFRMFGDLMVSVETGKTVTGEVKGTELFNHIGRDQERNERFNRAMSNASRMQIPALLSVYPFHRYRNIMDIGGGQGYFLAAVLKRYRRNKGVLFDLPKALTHARKVIVEQGLEGRMVAMEGDFFESVPEGGDLYVLKSVLHDWNDQDSLKILRNVHRVMQSTSRLLVIDSVIEAGNRPSFGKMTDILMMASAGGKERTRKEWNDLMVRAGFSICRIRPTISPHSLIEARKM